MSNIIKIDLDDVAQLVKDGEQILFTPEAEESLIQLLELKHKVEQAYETAKLRIEEAALKQDPNFKSVQADKIKVGYRTFGAKYSIDQQHIDDLSPDLYTKTTRFSPIAKAIDGYVKDHKALPLGINPNERKPAITIKLIEEFGDE